MKIASRAAARRYSRALIELTLRKPASAPGPGPAVSAEGLADELRASVLLLEASPELARALADPRVPVARRRSLVEAVWTKAGASPLLLRLLDLLAQQAGLGLLPGIEEAYRTAWNSQRGVVAAEAVAAVEIDEKSEAALRRALGKVSGLEVDLRITRDPGVLGGVLVRMGGKSYDGTVRGRLKALRGRLAHGA